MQNEKNTYQAELLKNRISKNYRQLKKSMRKNRVSCFRLYDKDIPEIPLAVDLYTLLPENAEEKIEAAKYWSEISSTISSNSRDAADLIKKECGRTFAKIYLYERPYEKNENEENEWINTIKKAAAETLGIPEENILCRRRKKQTDGIKRIQYEKEESEKKIEGCVMEAGQVFKVNLTDYLDTGLFFDMRPLRKTVRENCSGKSVLNLFCYTGSFSVYAAEGNASSVTSVDMSRTYLEWAKENFRLNGFSDDEKYKFENSDVVKFLEAKINDGKDKYDLIILDPPTFSNSKKTDTVFDINRDWPALVENCTRLLSENGVLYFSTNSRKLDFNESCLPAGFSSKDITASTIPDDYRNKKIHRVWKIARS